ncbi:MAG: hypothetical protein V1658_01050 [Candidatus Micrarchaeota archaeon]
MNGKKSFIGVLMMVMLIGQAAAVTFNITNAGYFSKYRIQNIKP